MQSLEGKLAMVTGAAGAIGRAIVEAFAKNGVRVLMVDVNEAGLEEMARKIEGETVPLVLDIGDEGAVARTCAKVREKYGSVDILVNNAGLLSTSKPAETTPEEWRRILRVNLDGAFYLSHEWLPDMQAKKWGRIINMGSAGAKTGGITTGPAYTSSKAAIHGLTFSFARHSAPYGVTVNAIAPAFVKTPMVLELPEAEQKKAMASIPVGRFCEPEEIAHVVLFLASPMSGFITGELIDVNGGVVLD
jgi:3-oxoacyl-[acyl-carrier protein] reductase